MCKPSLFYFTKNITDSAYPEETCLHHVKNYIHENGKPYADVCTVACVLTFWMFLIHFSLYRCVRQKDGEVD